MPSKRGISLPLVYGAVGPRYKSPAYDFQNFEVRGRIEEQQRALQVKQQQIERREYLRNDAHKLVDKTKVDMPDGSVRYSVPQLIQDQISADVEFCNSGTELLFKLSSEPIDVREDYIMNILKDIFGLYYNSIIAWQRELVRCNDYVEADSTKLPALAEAVVTQNHAIKDKLKDRELRRTLCGLAKRKHMLPQLKAMLATWGYRECFKDEMDDDECCTVQ